MARLNMPTDPAYLAAFGRVALAHSHLELVQRFLVRTLGDVSMIQALDATESLRAADVRKRVRKLARQRQFPEDTLLRIDALLGGATTLSRERNDLLHRAVQLNRHGDFVQKTQYHLWGPAPSCNDLEDLARRIQQLAEEINHERLRGFIRNACRDHPLRRAP